MLPVMEFIADMNGFRNKMRQYNLNIPIIPGQFPNTVNMLSKMPPSTNLTPMAMSNIAVKKV